MDNGPREGLDKFLKAASDSPETVLHYEFMQDYKVLCWKIHFDLQHLWTTESAKKDEQYFPKRIKGSQSS